MKVALVSSFVPHVRGGYRFIVDWLEVKLKERGHQVECVYLPFNEQPDRLLAQMTAYRFVDLEAADRVICFRPPAHLVQHRHKVVWFIHHFRGFYDLWDSPYRSVPDTPKGRALRQTIIDADTRGLREARRVFSNSRVVGDRLRDFNGVESEVLYPPILHPGQYRCDGYGDEVVFLSRIEPHKRQDLLVRALGYTRTPVRVRLCGASFTESYVADLKEHATRLGVSDRLAIENRWISEEEKLDILASCLAVAYLPLDEDSYGYASLEACHSRKCVITTTDSGGVLELIEDGVNGLVCPPEPAALAERLDALFSDRSLAERLGERASARPMELGIDWDTVIGNLLA